METTENVKIEGLSVGDWVQDRKGNTAQIIGIELWSGAYEVNVRINGVDVGLVSASSCYPIPITPEILEKNGLMRVTEEECCKAYCCNDFLIRRSKFSCTDWWQVDVHYKQYVAHLSGYIQYVHQLQHLLTINECDKKIEL